jgi:hypothetical protein
VAELLCGGPNMAGIRKLLNCSKSTAQKNDEGVKEHYLCLVKREYNGIAG